MNWKKAAAAGILAIGAAGLIAGCGVSGDKKAAASSAQKPEKIVAGLDDTFAPMGFRDDSGKIVGFDVDMAAAVSKEIGVPIEFKPIDWASKESELNSGRINVIWNGLSVTDERKKVLDFTDPYLNNKQIYVVRADSPIQSAKELKGKNVCSQEGSTSQTAVEKQAGLKESFATWKLYPDFTSCFMDIDSGRMDALVGDSVLIGYYMQKKPGEYRILPDLLANEHFAIGVKKGNKELLDLLNGGIKKVVDSGEAGKISQKWFGEDLTYKAK